MKLKRSIYYIFLLMLLPVQAIAVSYTLPDDLGKNGTPFKDCNKNNKRCSDTITLSDNTTINLTSTFTLRITSGSFLAENTLTINANSNQMHLDVDSGNITFKNDTNYTGNINSDNGSIDFEGNIIISGNITAASNITFKGTALVAGNVTSSNGNIKFENQTTLSGNIHTSNGNVQVTSNNSNFSGNISTDNGTIEIADGSNVTGTCTPSDSLGNNSCAPSPPPSGAISCSSKKDVMNINEINMAATEGDSKFIEAKVLQSQTSPDPQKWQFCIYDKHGNTNCSQFLSSDIKVYQNGTYINDGSAFSSFSVNDYLVKEFPTGTQVKEIIIVDENNLAIDHLQFCKNSCSSAYWNVNSSCSEVIENIGANVKDLARLPDGTGNWSNTGEKNGTKGDNNDSSSSCTLGSFDVSQPAYALACPSTPAQITITAKCTDNTTKTDYTGTPTITTNPSTNPPTLGTLSTFTNGLATVTLYHNKKETVAITATDGASTGTGSATSFHAYGFNVGVTSPLTCGSNNVTLRALGQNSGGAGCSTITGFSGNKALSISLSNHDRDLSGTSASPAYNKTETVNFSNGVASISIDDVGYSTGISVSHSADPYDGNPFSAMVGNSSTVKVLPANYVISATTGGVELDNTDPNSEKTIANPNVPVLKAGSDTFNVSITPKCSNNVTPANYTASVSLGNETAPDFSFSGSLTGTTTTSFTAGGNAEFTGLSYTEVGHFNFTATSSYLNEPLSFTKTGVGRFVPDHFEITSQNVATNWSCNFAYLGQANIAFAYTIQAYNNTSPIKNYTGSHAKASFNYVLEDADKGTGPSLSRINLPNYSLINWSSSGYTGNPSSTLVTLARDTTPDGPFQPLNIGIQVLDDNESSSFIDIPLTGLDMNPDTTAAPCTTCNAVKLGGVNVLYGRLKVDNAYGSEFLPLNNIALTTEYYNGSFFTINTDDTNCSTFDPATAPLNSPTYGGNLSSGDLASSGSVTSFSNGLATFNIHKQGDTSQGPGKTGFVEYVFTTDDWLKYDWDNNAGTPDTTKARANFGIFNRSNRIIYTREKY